MNIAFKTAATGCAFLIATVFVVPASSARTIVAISGKHSAAEIKSTCGKSGGRYFEGDYTYGCTNDKKGTEVICDKGNGKCHGYVPILTPLGGANSVGPGVSEILR